WETLVDFVKALRPSFPRASCAPFHRVRIDTTVLVFGQRVCLRIQARSQAMRTQCFRRSHSCRGERRPERMKIVPGYGSLPARFASIKDLLKKPGALEAARTQGFSEEKNHDDTTTKNSRHPYMSLGNVLDQRSCAAARSPRH